MFPLVTSDGVLNQAPMTLYLMVDGQGSVETLCRFVPRVLEAVTITVDNNPIVVSGNEYQLGDLGTRLLRTVNKAFKTPQVSGVFLSPVSRRMGEGSAIQDLPGNSNKCRGLKNLPFFAKALVSDKRQEVKTVLIPSTVEIPVDLKKNPSLKADVTTPQSPVTSDTPSVLPAGAVPKRPLEQLAAGAGPCNKIADVWSPGFHDVFGQNHWLERIFTLDDDHNGSVDNIGFILKAEDRPDLFIYYFPSPGRQSVVSVPTLRLTDDRDVINICFGQANFKKPEDKKKPKPQAFKAPDLAKEMEAKSEKEKSEAETASGKRRAPSSGGTVLEGPLLIFMIVAGAGVLLIIGGGIGYVIAKRRSDRRREERRKQKDRRTGDRRKQQVPHDGDDKRKEDQRKESDRRKDDDRRQEDDRRQ